MNKDEEFKSLFFAEALENYEELNRLFVRLEKNYADKSSISAIFRILHTLKANAAAMGYDSLAESCHVLEDIFSQISRKESLLDAALFETLFKANDKIGEFMTALREDKEVAYKGFVTRLKIVLRNMQTTENEIVTENITPENTLFQDPANEEDTEKDFTKQDLNFSEFVQVPAKKLDDLLDLAGELAVEKDRLMTQLGTIDDERKRTNELLNLQRLTSDLQYSVMNVRLVPVNILFQKFQRICRDVAVAENKKVELILEGTDTEIDRQILQIIGDSMVHLVRNAVSHGIENAEERQKNGKNPIGTIRLVAYNDKSSVIIKIIDDGGGIDPKKLRKKAVEKKIISIETANRLSDEEAIDLIYESGFSASDNVTNISGRGVGMEVVKKAVSAAGGRINVQTEIKKGTTFTLTLPASMVVRNVLLCENKNITYAFPIIFTDAVVSLKKSTIQRFEHGLITTYANKTIPIVFLNDAFSPSSYSEFLKGGFLQNSFDELTDDILLNAIIVAIDNRKIAVIVEKLTQQREVIEKPLKKPVHNTPFVSGASILGNGSVCLVLDLPFLATTLSRLIRT